MGSSNDKALLQALGRRLARYRLNRNWTQTALAARAGLSLPTLKRLEGGKSTQLSNFIRVLRALDLLDQLDALLPTPPSSPLQSLQMQGKLRQRASSPASQSSDDEQSPAPWTWADDEH